jgi:hypothetical protein
MADQAEPIITARSREELLYLLAEAADEPELRWSSGLALCGAQPPHQPCAR